jgi:16S rRNA U516 pseudouridylate synthase RsuA-like enzyme
MLDSIHHSVTKLRRVRIGHIKDEGLLPGQYREMTTREIKRFFQPSAASAKRGQKQSSKRRNRREESKT